MIEHIQYNSKHANRTLFFVSLGRFLARGKPHPFRRIVMTGFDHSPEQSLTGSAQYCIP